MASEIRVNKIENRSGLGTVTFADTGVDLAGIVTATTFSGSGASLTNVPDSALSAVTASKLSGALPAISAASLTNVPAANVVGVHTSLTVTNATTTGTAVVGGGVTISESGIEASGIGITCANINGTQIGGRRNLIINGDMNVAQRATSSTATGSTQQTVDRFYIDVGGADEQPEQAQVDVASGTTPYTLGFRKSYKIINGNQTSGAGGTDYIAYIMKLEAQDIANSGWNYTDPNSFITLSFWIKSSVAQAFSGSLRSVDGSVYHYKYDTPSLSADTWTKVVKTIPGNANLTFDNDNGHGFTFSLQAFIGTTYTSSNSDTETWLAYSSTRFANNMTSTWYTTNDATLELTGVQLEVGSQATAFEHRSFAEELELCKRYYQVLVKGNSQYFGTVAYQYSGSLALTQFRLTPEMRSSPSLDQSTGTDYYTYYTNNSSNKYNSFTGLSLPHTKGGAIYVTASVSVGYAGAFATNNASAKIAFAAEL